MGFGNTKFCSTTTGLGLGEKDSGLRALGLGHRNP